LIVGKIEWNLTQSTIRIHLICSKITGKNIKKT
jgi:hypothetical protein